MNAASTDLAVVMGTVQVPMPLHPEPVHPEKVELASGTAVRLTSLPCLKSAAHVVPQSIPAGELVTVPVPVPDLVTLSWWVMAEKSATTEAAAVIVTTQVPVPLQPEPLQPVKVELTSGVAVSVTVVPWVKFAEHVAPQSIPAGELVTVPDPVPVLLTFRE